jgi:hypothetical protein
MLEIKKTHDGVLLARRLDGKQLTPADREEAKRIAAAESPPDPAADPILAVGDWYPEFHSIHRTIVKETPDFDYREVRERNPELYREIKAKEALIDHLGPARLSEILVLMREWRELILKAECKPKITQ